MSVSKKVDVLLVKRSNALHGVERARFFEEVRKREQEVRRDLRDLSLSKEQALEACRVQIDEWAEHLRERVRDLSASDRAVRRFRRRLDRVSSEIDEEGAVGSFEEELRAQRFLERVQDEDFSFSPSCGGDAGAFDERDAPADLWDPSRTAKYMRRARQIRDFFTQRLLFAARERGEIERDCREIAARIRHVGEQLSLPVAGVLAEVPASCLASTEPASQRGRALECGNVSLVLALSAAVQNRTAELEKIVACREALQQGNH